MLDEALRLEKIVNPVIYDVWTLWDMVEGYLQQICNEDVRVVYSAYSFDEDGYIPLNLPDVPIKGSYRVYYHNLFTGEQYLSPVLDSPNWLNLAAVANRALFATHDVHHVYLEGIHFHSMHYTGLPVYRLSMGS